MDLSTYDLNNDDKITPDELSVMFVFAGYDKSAGSVNTPYIGLIVIVIMRLRSMERPFEITACLLTSKVTINLRWA